VRLVREDGRVACERCVVADTAAKRMKGLLGRAGLDEGEGLLIKPAGSIHMFFMRFPIDAVFLDRELRVVKVVPKLRPWRIAAARGAKQVVELGAGEAARRGIEPGQQLTLTEEERDEPAGG
jgi:uncharacterized membrane protein (UPF0127 family)